MFTLAEPGTADADALLQVWEASVRATHHFLSEEDILFFKDVICGHNAFAQVRIVCAYTDDGAIAGFLGLSADSIEMLFVAPAYIGKGAGKALMEYALSIPGIYKVDVNEQNPRACGFYMHFGFKVVTRSPLDGTCKPYPILHMQLEKSIKQ